MFDPALTWVGRRTSDHSPGRMIPGSFWCRGTMLSGQVKGAVPKEGFCAYSSVIKLNVCRLNLGH